MNKAQRRVISNIFRDVTKLTVVALVIGQFVPGQEFNYIIFFEGILGSTLMAWAAVRFAVDNDNKEVDE
jgi:hypothetical protein